MSMSSMTGSIFGEAGRPCCVCSDPVPEVHFAECMSCLQPFHLRMTETEKTARDCGLTFIHDEDFVVFMCTTCFASQQAE